MNAYCALRYSSEHVCLSGISLSPPVGFAPMWAVGLRAVRVALVCSRASLSLQEQSWPAWRHIELSCAEHSVVVGCLDCASLPIAVAVVHVGQVFAVLLAVFPARSHGLVHLIAQYILRCTCVDWRAELYRSVSCPEIKQGYPLNLSI